MAMQWKVYQRIQATARFATLLALCFVMLPAHAERVRELASFAGVRDNQLVGYGLVVGLDGSGDQTTQAPFTSQSLTNKYPKYQCRSRVAVRPDRQERRVPSP